MFERLRRMVRSTPGDSGHRGRRREEGRRDNSGSHRGETVGGTTGGTMERARGEAMRQNGEQASCVGHIGPNEYQYLRPAPSDSQSWNVLGSRRRYEFPTFYPRHPPDYSPPPPYSRPPSSYGTPYETSSPLSEHGRRSTSSRSGSVVSNPVSRHNAESVNHADTYSRRRTATGRSSGSYPPSYRSTDDTSFRSHTSREPLISTHTSRERMPYSSRTSARRQNHRYSYASLERPHTSSSRDGESFYSSY